MVEARLTFLQVYPLASRDRRSHRMRCVKWEPQVSAGATASAPAKRRRRARKRATDSYQFYSRFSNTPPTTPLNRSSARFLQVELPHFSHKDVYRNMGVLPEQTH